MLKKKITLNYRKGCKSDNCGRCNSFIPEFTVHMIGGDVKGIEPRCNIMGLENSIRYRVNPKFICDAYN